MKRLLLNTLWLMSILVALPCAFAQQDGWPRTVALAEGEVTIYSLQVDEMSGDTLRYRAALAYRSSPGAEPVFGAGWFASQVEVDRQRGIVYPKNLEATGVRFPAGTDDLQAGLSAALATQFPDWNLDYPIDELKAALNTAASGSSEGLLTTPPRIVYRDHPALLISIDGQPVQREIENSPYEAVINTPYPLIIDGKSYYLNAAKGVWYRADKVTGPYRFDANPPVDIAAMVDVEEAGDEDGSTLETITAANAPEIVVSMEPAELLVTDGPADFVPLVDDLLVLQNSEDDVFMHVSSQRYYIVLAGRWYQAGSLNGPWTYHAADELPSAFAQIPVDSEQADTRVYVAGTEEANEAVLDAYVPQAAAVARGEADIEVAYDGEPSFKPVDGAELAYAENTGSTVLQSDRLYYLVEDGVWYVSTSPNGPWQVSDYRPDEVETILPSSPVYNVRYVYVYDSTPEVVYVGYTPGYTGSYVYHNTIVYGTGWYYRPWVSPRYYYPRYSTWGFNVRYDPWYGWNFGLSWNWGPFSFAYYPGGYWHHNHYWHHRHYSHWGPRGYRHRYPRYGHHGYKRDRYGHRDYGNGRDRYGWDDYGHERDRRGRDHRGYNSERSRNLYSDRAQPARVVNTRDRSSRSRNSRDDATRQVNNPGSSRSRGLTQMGDKKVGRSRITPVKTTDLAMKARIRDANRDTRQRGRSQENKSHVIRGTDRGVVRTNGSAGMKAGGEKNRITPVSRTGKQKFAGPDIRPVNDAKSRSSRGVTQIGDKKVSRSRTEPIKSTDLAMKARVRDDNVNDRQRRSYTSNGSGSKKVSAEKNRITPVRSTGGRQLASNRIRPAVSTSRDISSRSSKKVSAEKNRITPVSRAGGRQSRSPDVRSVTSVSSRKAKGQASPVTKPPQRSVASRQPQARASASKSQQRRSVPVRQPSSRAITSHARQQPRKVVSAPMQKPQRSSSVQRTKQVAKTAPRPSKSQQKANNRQSSSKHSRGSRNSRN